MKGKRDRSVAALLVVDVTEETLDLVAGPVANPTLVPIINVLTKRFGYRFGVSIFTRPPGTNLVRAMELPVEAIVFERGPSAEWLAPLLQSKVWRGQTKNKSKSSQRFFFFFPPQSVSSLYICGVNAEAVAELAKVSVFFKRNKEFTFLKEALRIGVAVFIIRDAVIPGSPGPNAAALKETLEKSGALFVESARI